MDIKKLVLFLAIISLGAAPSRTQTYTPGEIISSSEVTENENNIYNYLQVGVDTYADGSIVNADISPSAAIAGSKLQALSVGANAGVIPSTGVADAHVAAGAAIFSIVGLMLPYIVSLDAEHLRDVLARNSGFLGAVANVVVGVGFLGAGIIVKEGIQPRGLTTAATVWFVAAVGVLCGIGLLGFAAIAAVGTALLLFILRKIDLYGMVEKVETETNNNNSN